MLEDLPQWICKSCGRPLDDHQLRGTGGKWLSVPMCVEPGTISRGIRMPGGQA